MRLAELAAASVQVGATAARSTKTARLAEALRAAGPDEIGLAVRYLSGELRQRFARVVRYRPDKTAEQADTVDDVRRLHVDAAEPARRRDDSDRQTGSGPPSRVEEHR